jgi:hypothetical protein
MRRKGERPLPKRLNVLTPQSPVCRSINEGQSWFDAWRGEECTPLASLSRTTGIPRSRLDAITRGDRVSRAEIDALARAWAVSAADLISTLPDPTLVVE